MKKLFVFVSVMLCLAACKTIAPAKQLTRVVKDSTWTETTYHKRDTTIFVPGDVVRFKLPFSKITEVPVIQSSGRTTAMVSRTGDNVDITVLTDSLALKIDLLEKHIRQFALRQESTTAVEPVIIKKSPFFTRVLAWIGGILLLIVGGRIAFKLYFKR